MSNELIFISEGFIGFSFIVLALWLGGPTYIKVVAISATIMMNIFVLKQFEVFGLYITGGNVSFAMVFLCTDALTELYGPKEAKTLVVLGFFASILFVVFSQFMLGYTPSSFDFAQPSMQQLFVLSPRIVFFSLLSYYLSQNISIYLFYKMKCATQGRFLWLRSNCANMIAQTFDTVFFTTTALYGIIDNIGQAILFTLLVKIFLTLIDTPFLYLVRYVYNHSPALLGEKP